MTSIDLKKQLPHKLEGTEPSEQEHECSCHVTFLPPYVSPKTFRYRE